LTGRDPPYTEPETVTAFTSGTTVSVTEEMPQPVIPRTEKVEIIASTGTPNFMEYLSSLLLPSL
jgi:hypothetical protein